MGWLDWVYGLIDPVRGTLFEALILPVMHAAGLGNWAEEAFEALGAALAGLLFIGVFYAILRPLEVLVPVERWPDRKAVRVDVLYTVLYRTGLLPMFFFFALNPVWLALQGQLHGAGIVPWQLEDLLPYLRSSPLAAFLTYLAVLDLAEYWRHRLQHRFQWWWGLHSIHHAQRQMSLWTDERNHVLDGLIEAAWRSGIALAIGVPAAHFFAIVLVTQFVESLSHANVRIHFGRIGNRLLVSPRFHRRHHGMGIGHEGRAHGCNFATLFPAWDMLFGTANHGAELPATGIRDPLDGADYGEGFIDQQANGLRRMWRALA